VDNHLRFAVDVRGTGRADILGFGSAGVLWSENEGQLKFSTPSVVLDAFSTKQGWHPDRHPRFLGDTTGNGFPDIVGFSDQGVVVSRNNGVRFQKPYLRLEGLCTAQNWHFDKHPRTIADLTGDGKVDLIGFGDPGVYVALNNGDGTFQSAKLALKNFGYFSSAGSWRVESHPRFVVDVTGDGKADIVGFGNRGVVVALNNGDGTFKEAKLVIESFGYNQGWRVDRQLRLLVDMTGDGKVDIIGFASKHICVSYNLGNGKFGPLTKLIEALGINSGWKLDNSIRMVTNVF
jgi:hypothetical protein